MLVPLVCESCVSMPLYINEMQPGDTVSLRHGSGMSRTYQIYSITYPASDDVCKNSGFPKSGLIVLHTANSAPAKIVAKTCKGGANSFFIQAMYLSVGFGLRMNFDETVYMDKYIAHQSRAPVTCRQDNYLRIFLIALMRKIGLRVPLTNTMLLHTRGYLPLQIAECEECVHPVRLAWVVRLRFSNFHSEKWFYLLPHANCQDTVVQLVQQGPGTSHGPPAPRTTENPVVQHLLSEQEIARSIQAMRNGVNNFDGAWSVGADGTMVLDLLTPQIMIRMHECDVAMRSRSLAPDSLGREQIVRHLESTSEYLMPFEQCTMLQGRCLGTIIWSSMPRAMQRALDEEVRYVRAFRAEYSCRLCDCLLLLGTEAFLMHLLLASRGKQEETHESNGQEETHESNGQEEEEAQDSMADDDVGDERMETWLFQAMMFGRQRVYSRFQVHVRDSCMRQRAHSQCEDMEDDCEQVQEDESEIIRNDVIHDDDTEEPLVEINDSLTEQLVLHGFVFVDEKVTWKLEINSATSKLISIREYNGHVEPPASPRCGSPVRFSRVRASMARAKHPVGSHLNVTDDAALRAKIGHLNNYVLPFHRISEVWNSLDEDGQNAILAHARQHGSISVPSPTVPIIDFSSLDAFEDHASMRHRKSWNKIKCLLRSWSNLHTSEHIRLAHQEIIHRIPASAYTQLLSTWCAQNTQEIVKDENGAAVLSFAQKKLFIRWLSSREGADHIKSGNFAYLGFARYVRKYFHANDGSGDDTLIFTCLQDYETLMGM